MGRGRTQDCVECSKLLLRQRGIHAPSTPRLHVSVFGPFCLVPPSPLLRGGPGGCQRRGPGLSGFVRGLVGESCALGNIPNEPCHETEPCETHSWPQFIKPSASNSK